MEKDSYFLERPKKALVSRLYKKYSMSKFDSILEQSSIQKQEQTNVSQLPTLILDDFMTHRSKKLVPKIATQKRLKPIDSTQNNISTFDEGIQIERGKFIINQSKSLHYKPNQLSIQDQQQSFAILKSLETQTGKQTKKLSKINNRILSGFGKQIQKFVDETRDEQQIKEEDQLLKNYNQMEIVKEELKKKKIQNHKKGKKIQKNNKEQDNLTPQDFINLIKNDPDMADEFTYLNRQSHPYDLKIVDFNEKNKNEYITISARGITHFIKGEAYFQTIEDWERDAKLFQQLLQITFFKQYKKWKSFSLWKKQMRRSLLKDCSEKLNKDLFQIDRNLGFALFKIRDLCIVNKTISFLDFGIVQPMKYEEFKQYQESYRMTTADVKMDTIENSIKDILINNCRKSLISFKEENRIHVKDEKGQVIDDDQAPLLVGDETGQEMPFTQEATIRTHFKKLYKFVKLVDYVILESKIDMINNCTYNIAQNIYQRNLNNSEDSSEHSNFSCWIIQEVQAVDYDLVFIPNREELKKLFEDLITKSVVKICSKHKSMIKLEDLQKYITNDSDNSNWFMEEQIGFQDYIFSDKAFKHNLNQVKLYLEEAFNYVEKYSQFLIPFIKRYQTNINIDFQEFQNHDNEKFKNAINQFIKEDEEFQEIQSSQDLGLLYFENDKLKSKIKNCAQTCLYNLYNLLPNLLNEKATNFTKIINKHNQQIAHFPSTVEQFIKISEDVQNIQNEMESLSADKQQIDELYILIDGFKIKCSELIKQNVKDSTISLKTLREKLMENSNSVDQNLTKFRNQCERMAPPINNRVKDLNMELSLIPYSKDDAPYEKTILQITDLSQKVNDLNEQAKKIMRWQVDLQAEVNTFEKLQLFTREFQIIDRLWMGISEWQSKKDIWLDSQILDLDLEETGITIERLIKTAHICAKEMEANPNARDFQLKIQNFKNIFETIVALRDPAMTEEAWADVRTLIESQNLCSNPFKDINNSIYTLKWIQEFRIHSLKDQIQEIALRANKQAELKKTLKVVKIFWESSKLSISYYQNRNDYFIIDIKKNEDLISKLDDIILTLNNILANRFSIGIKKEVEEQMFLFRYLQELLDEWYKHQRNWSYLEPILNSQYAQKNMAKEVKIFNQSDLLWRKIMKKANEVPLAHFWAKDYLYRSYLKILEKNNIEFEKIQKALEELLEKKRDIFQRFYFLSNDELLEILSQAQNLQSVIHHLRKCFENIVKLKFDNNDIPCGMISAENEQVLLKNYTPKGDEVEIWFKDLEEAMKHSLKYVFRQALSSFDRDDVQRKDWVISFPSQVILGLDAVIWTKTTEENYLHGEYDSDLYDWFMGIQNQLNDLTQLIGGKLTDVQRKTLSSLAVQNVHQRDIIEELAETGVENINDFKWQQQLRLYYEEDSLFARQVNAKLPYCYEYLGATGRLVITPLTDRCWMTITGALGIKLGAAPAGPAGTGKTESCKDLSKFLAKYCLVYNCSDQVNVRIMEKLFLGLCQTGSWACLDEFNRIDIEVLSVIAQQVLTIREGLLDRKDKFEFFGKLIVPADTADMGIFTTMNPGYAGRTELPDNLKVLFRPVAMMIPDYTLIAEIMLFSEGFLQSRPLSQKMTKLYKLTSEQLSKQDHYDFGMRAVKSVLNMAGNLKRSEPTLGEDLVLIRAIIDSNVPKFLSNDIPLFNAIVQDLFPEVQIQPIQNTQLEKVILQKIDEKNFKQVPTFIEKIFQFHETLKVRFGVMLVGPTMSGKSTCIKILQESYIELHNSLVIQSLDHENNHPLFQNVLCSILNPKAISMEELYGEYDQLSQSWTDGLASTLIRDYSQMEDLQKKWVCFDGPVDAIWIENMNSVLDDSMTLCLSNGERIKLKPQLKMLFEVQDLAAASPATVSRCGMVYIDENVVGYKPIVSNYFQENLIKLIPKKEDQENFQQNLLLGFAKILNFIKKYNFRQPIVTAETNLVIAICRNINLILSLDKGAHGFLQKLTSQKSLDKLLLWALSWGVGSQLSTQNLQQFEKCLQDIFTMDLIPRGSIFDYYFEYRRAEGEFVPWTDDIPNFKYEPSLSYFELVVPTKDTVCYSWFIQKSILLLQPIFLSGMTGTGKTLICHKILSKMKEEGLITTLEMTFSAKTSSLSTQLQIESKLQSQRKNRKVILVPPPGKKLVVFIDDINMPSVEQYGAQPPIELLRQQIDYKGMYDRKGLYWKYMEEVVIITSASPPGGGRSVVTNRFTRHFNVMNVPDSSQEILTDIFSKIVKNFLKTNMFKKELQELGENNSIVFATLEIYEQIQRTLMPTPSRSHYIFNLRDVSKVFQGLLLAKPIVINKVETLAKLWLHETCRVFHDRLIDQNDRSWFLETILKTCFVWFKFDWPISIFEGGQPLIFGDFIHKNIQSSDRQYQNIVDINLLNKVITNYMQEDTKLNIVLFRDAIEHMSRIARVLSLQRGHFMLVGVSGSGKKSLITLATAMSLGTLMTIEPKKNYGRNEWKEDLFKFMMMTAVKNQNVVFLFDDTCILQESFVEDINNLLNSGDIPNLLGKEEIDEIRKQLQDQAIKFKINDTYEIFADRVRNQLHVVLALSPVGDKLRVRMRMFPSIVNCTTIDWLNPWPEEALLTVAKINFQDLNFDDMSLEQKDSISKCCVFTHQSVQISCENFYNNLRRKIYITPKSYLDLINAFKELLNKKYQGLENSKNKLKNGLTKLKDANDTIKELKIELINLQPVLDQKTIEIEQLIDRLNIDRLEANKVKAIVQEEEQIVNDQTQTIKEVKDDADRVLQAALPMLKQANESLNILDRKIVSEIKGNNNPNPLVLFTLECINCLFDEKQDWDSIKKVLSDTNLLQKMKNYDVYNIKEKTEIAIKKKIASNPEFTIANVKQKSEAAQAICGWVLAVSKFTDVNKEINRKRAKVEDMDVQLMKANKILLQKQSELKKVVDQVELVEKQFLESKLEQEDLIERKILTSDRLERAEELTSGLADEQVRWKETVEAMEEEIKYIMGNIYVASSSVAYYGPFTGVYRDELVNQWLSQAQKQGLLCSEKYNLASSLGDHATIRNWAAKGLPSDSVSVNNGILVYNSRSYPLFIDPQLQASKWIKNLESENRITVVKMSAPDLPRHLENSIRMGEPLLIEDMEDQFEPILEPILSKQFNIVQKKKVVKIGDSELVLDPNFKLFIQTKVSNPNFLPEIFIRVTVINFTVTTLGLEEQLLADVVIKEMPQVEATKNELILQISEGKIQLQVIEDKILELLTSSKGMILDDVELINNLKISKETSQLVKYAVLVAEEKQIEIEAARAQYKEVATRASIIFFVIADLALIDPMYQFSLGYFKKLFGLVIETAQKSNEVQQRVQILIQAITEFIYQNVCRGLFNDHKSIFSFLLASAIYLNNGEISKVEWNYFIRGIAFSKDKPLPHPANTKINVKTWELINNLKMVSSVFTTLAFEINGNIKSWESWIFSKDIYLENPPAPFCKQIPISAFQRLLLVKTVKSEKSLFAMNIFVKQTLGKKFTDTKISTIDDAYQDTSYNIPLVFILSKGADPQDRIIKFSKQNKISNIEVISLGQGQGKIAEEKIKQGIVNGCWVILQNCHLGKSFMPQLEKIIYSLNEISSEGEKQINNSFRLILTSMPCDYFPVSILQNSVKLTNEPPKGLKANIMKTYAEMTQEKFEECSNLEAWKKLLFSCSFFHAMVQERRKYGPLGWNIRYEFNDSDLDTQITILKNMLESHSEIPWQALRYVIGEIIYGGRITDDWDRRTLKTILDKYLVEEALERNFKLSESGIYVSPPSGSLVQYRDIIKNFPEQENPEIFGLHDNANITYQLTESNIALQTILSIQPRETGLHKEGEQTTDKVVSEMCSMFQEKIPERLRKLEKQGKKVFFEDPKLIDPLYICCNQECQRFNILTEIIEKSLINLKKAIKGEVLMSSDLDKMQQSLMNNQVPLLWQSKAYPSLKPLGSWFEDYTQRMQFFKNWLLGESKPKSYWLSGFFFPQGFLTSVLQNYARSQKIAIDVLSFSFRFLTTSDATIINASSEYGAYITGLYMEGCQFDYIKCTLEESQPGIMYSKSPIIEFIPTQGYKSNPADYTMPVYKTTLRAGTLSTTGHSTNFILPVDVPTKKKPDWWVMKGAAFICMLND